ncbi:MAG: hypothetical protein IKX31_00415 [Muribaculaceae bacterium]|nr:hypothetical protein [Muribaculaceae bacterium]
MKSTQVSILLAVVMAMLPLLLLAQETSKIDTVKVIDKPNQVVIAEDGDQVVVNVNGAYQDKDYKYEYRAKPACRGFISNQTENHSLSYQLGECDSTKSKRSFDVFMSDLYVGFGGNSVEQGTRDIIKRSTLEIGILNLVGLGVTLNRTRLSLGMGFNWTRYGLNQPYVWSRSGDGIVGFDALTGEVRNPRTSLLVRSMQFPLLFNQYLGKHWAITVGPIFNWNYYADFNSSYCDDINNYSITTHGLNQRKFSVDGIVMVSWRGLGAYFRYAPQSVFKDGFGPEIKNRWALGLIIRGVGFCGR